MTNDDGFTRAYVVSADGTAIAHDVIGSGPGLVIVHGVGRMARNYRDLARALAGSFTVHVMERRGRGASGPKGDAYRIEREREDLHALMKATGAPFLFGHSYGGLVALEKLDLEEFCRLFQSPRETNISETRGGVAGGVVVHNDQREGGVDQRRAKDLARVGDALVDGAEGNLFDPNELAAGIEQQHAKRFLMQPPHFRA